MLVWFYVGRILCSLFFSLGYTYNSVNWLLVRKEVTGADIIISKVYVNWELKMCFHTLILKEAMEFSAGETIGPSV